MCGRCSRRWTRSLFRSAFAIWCIAWYYVVMPARKVPSDDVLRDLYGSGLSGREIAVQLGLNVKTVICALSRLGISSRSPEETKTLQGERGIVVPRVKYWLGKKQPPEMVEKRISKIRGANHWLWKGGDSDRRAYRKVVDKQLCARCGARQNLAIHHVNFDHYDDVPDNLIVLCVSCHSSVHKQAYWDAIHAGKEPPRSNAPIGWKRR